MLGLKNAKEGKPWPLQDVFTDIGNLAFRQLATLRHRGALTTVSQTFLTCCQLSPRLGANAHSGSLLETWYQVCQIFKIQFTETDVSRAA
jgi:hypothetical protein